MKTGIHPDVNMECAVSCSCGANFIVASTLPEIKVEICSYCHPFYTGKQKLVDTEGRVDKFMKRQEAAKAKAAAKAAPAEEEKKEEKAEVKEETKTADKAETKEEAPKEEAPEAKEQAPAEETTEEKAE